ncbi:RecX family transcriptional regulator [Candidatus Oleimmundimicrobium sp.]|uniref:regulatory protein RecX n=1 Tax=Candidatus Oleimmundimicrobium sp. TaxID=3060597 RepID=UPI002721C759|nr:RecX family transcriptional regulator [Candidatus Oleimmundimicrobium sp.]MDO8885428.1 RecX family transcriptional regulator [Candidatus Oleimmundimicrobium sp.]
MFEEKTFSDEEKGAINKTLNYLKYRPRSTKEVVDYLKRKSYGQKLIEKVIKYLENFGYLDDLLFARIWIESRKEGKSLSRNRLKSELLLKGVNANLIEKELNSIYPEEEEEKIVFEVARKQLKKYERLNDDTKKRRLYNYLASKGFRPNILRRTCEKLLDHDFFID